MLVLLAGSAQAGILMQVPFPPTINFNSGDANQTNISWTAAYPYFLGDSFTMPNTFAPGSYWQVSQLTLWTNAPVGTELGDQFTNILLYSGAIDPVYANQQPLNLAAVGNFTVGTHVTDNPNIVVTDTALKNNGFEVWQVDFKNLNWVVNPGTTYAWAMDYNSTTDWWFFQAANAAGYSALVTGDPSWAGDGLFYAFNLGDLGKTYVTVNTLIDPTYAWNKSTDLNFVAQGELMPEPATVSLVGLGLLSAIVAARRRRK